MRDKNQIIFQQGRCLFSAIRVILELNILQKKKSLRDPFGLENQAKIITVELLKGNRNETTSGGGVTSLEMGEFESEYLYAILY